MTLRSWWMGILAGAVLFGIGLVAPLDFKFVGYAGIALSCSCLVALVIDAIRQVQVGPSGTVTHGPRFWLMGGMIVGFLMCLSVFVLYAISHPGDPFGQREAINSGPVTREGYNATNIAPKVIGLSVFLLSMLGLALYNRRERDRQRRERDAIEQTTRKSEAARHAAEQETQERRARAQAEATERQGQAAAEGARQQEEAERIKRAKEDELKRLRRQGW